MFRGKKWIKSWWKCCVIVHSFLWLTQSILRKFLSDLLLHVLYNNGWLHIIFCQVHQCRPIPYIVVRLLSWNSVCDGMVKEICSLQWQLGCSHPRFGLYQPRIRLNDFHGSYTANDDAELIFTTSLVISWLSNPPTKNQTKSDTTSVHSGSDIYQWFAQWHGYYGLSQWHVDRQSKVGWLENKMQWIFFNLFFYKFTINSRYNFRFRLDLLITKAYN